MESDTIFKGLYEEAKARVAAMEIKVVDVVDPVDPIEQTIFEVFAALSLETKYNNFDNH